MGYALYNGSSVEVRCRYFYGGSAVDVLVESEANTLGKTYLVAVAYLILKISLQPMKQLQLFKHVLTASLVTG